MLPVDHLEEKLALIRAGDNRAREDLIEAHRLFICRAAAKVCGRSLEWDRDDEVSIGLLAFNEALDRYDAGRGVPFKAFARLIIKSRVTDFLRRENRHTSHSGISLDQGEDYKTTSIENWQAWERHLEEEAARERREEIAEFQRVISGLGITFDDLVRSSPKHRDTRSNLLAMARQLAADDELFNQLMSTGKLPVTALSRLSGVGPKTIERGRRYIIATSVIWRHCEDFLHLCSFIKPPGKENGTP